MGTKDFQINCFDANACLVETITLEITVIPAVFGEIQSGTQGTCEVSLGLECPENYSITWIDDNGNTGEGLTYTCLLYTSPSPRDKRQSRMPSSA